MGIKTDESSFEMKIGAFGEIWTRDHYFNRTVYTSFQISKLLFKN
jgi:hypothetical protein